eukprot:1779435-Heterocapsa_arctica.AAC.1
MAQRFKSEWAKDIGLAGEDGEQIFRLPLGRRVPPEGFILNKLNEAEAAPVLEQHVGRGGAKDEDTSRRMGSLLQYYWWNEALLVD